MCNEQAKRHVHADLIIAWANGAEIQWKERSWDEWKDINKPSWLVDREYRIKPKPPVKKYLYAFQRATGIAKVSAMYFENDAEAIEYLESYEGFSHTSIRWVQRIDASVKEFP